MRLSALWRVIRAGCRVAWRVDEARRVGEACATGWTASAFVFCFSNLFFIDLGSRLLALAEPSRLDVRLHAPRIKHRRAVAVHSQSQ